ncbi:MAG: DNA replication and repair protein RecF, partial [candidate division WOR-3 bacterium]
MILKNLQLINFKKFSYLKLEFSEGVNFIIGGNGSGKTTIIEAISYLSIPRSFRGVKDEFLIKFNEIGWTIKAEISNLIEHNIQITYKKDGFKVIYLDGKKLKTFLKLFETFSVLTFHSNNYNLIDQSPELRRKFFDWFFSILNYEYFISLYKYKKILIQKNKALKLKSDISIWNKQLKQYSDYIMKFRKFYIEQLNSIIIEQNDKIKIEYKSSLNDKNFDDFIELEMKRGFSVIGPHRDNYEFYYEGKNAKFFASEGEKRKMLLNLVIAMVKLTQNIKKLKPVIAFDDPFNVLDEKNFKNFLEE